MLKFPCKNWSILCLWNFYSSAQGPCILENYKSIKNCWSFKNIAIKSTHLLFPCYCCWPDAIFIIRNVPGTQMLPWLLPLFKKKFIVIQLQLHAFSPHRSTTPQLNPPPSPTSTLPLDFVHMTFIVVPVIPSSHCPLPTPPWLLLDCS